MTIKEIEREIRREERTIERELCKIEDTKSYIKAVRSTIRFWKNCLKEAKAAEGGKVTPKIIS